MRSRRAERHRQEWIRSNRSRDLTQYLIYAAPTQSHTCRKVAEFKLAENWTNEGRSAGGSQSPDHVITVTRRETRSMTAHMRDVKYRLRIVRDVNWTDYSTMISEPNVNYDHIWLNYY
jgi:hypothetical protein